MKTALRTVDSPMREDRRIDLAAANAALAPLSALERIR